MSRAIIECEGQRSMTSLKQAGLMTAVSTIGESLGQIVLVSKAILSCDLADGDNHHRFMPETPLSQYEFDLIDRTKWARQSAGLTQTAVAEELDIPQDHYKHFESYRVLGVEMIETFCRVCAIDPNWLVTGRGRAPALSREDAEARMPSRPRRKAS